MDIQSFRMIHRISILAIVALLCVSFAVADEINYSVDANKTVTVIGRNYSYSFRIPTGFDGRFVQNAAPSLFSTDDEAVHLFLDTVEKGIARVKTADQYLAQEQMRMKLTFPDYCYEKIGSIAVAGSTAYAPLYRVSGIIINDRPQIEIVAIGDQKRFLLYFSLCAETQQALDRTLPAFKELLSSYVLLTDHTKRRKR